MFCDADGTMSHRHRKSKLELMGSGNTAITMH